MKTPSGHEPRGRGFLLNEQPMDEIGAADYRVPSPRPSNAPHSGRDEWACMGRADENTDSDSVKSPPLH